MKKKVFREKQKVQEIKEEVKKVDDILSEEKPRRKRKENGNDL